MNIQQKTIANSQIELIFDLSSEEFEPYLSESAKDLSRQKPVEGFRPGMAPREAIEKAFGSFKLYEVAAEKAVKRIFVNYVLEKKLDVIGAPEIEIQKLAPGNNFIFKAKTSLMPEIKLPDYVKIAQKTKKEKRDIKIEDKEIEETLKWVQNSRAENRESDKPAQLDWVVNIDLLTKHAGIPLESGKLENYRFVLGQGKFIPGVEEKIVGMNKRDIKNF